MGIFDFLTGGPKPPPNALRSAAQVVAASSNNGRSVYQNCRLDVVIQAPGIPPYASGFHGLVHRRHWPSPGTVLPVAVDPADPHRFTILWHELPDRQDQARRTAETLAATMRAGHPAPFGAAQIHVMGDASHLTEDQKAKLRGLGIDPDQLPGARPQPPDTISQLERLAALRAQGILTDAEFDAQKRRILGA